MQSAGRDQILYQKRPLTSPACMYVSQYGVIGSLVLVDWPACSLFIPLTTSSCRGIDPILDLPYPYN